MVAQTAGVAFRAVAADCAHGDQDSFRAELRAAGLPFVLALKPHRSTWVYGPDVHTPVDAARMPAWHGPSEPGDWTAVRRTFRDGHTATWWAADAVLGAWGPDGWTRLVVATHLPRPGEPRTADSPHPPAGLAELVRIHGVRNWIEQSYKQVKDEPGWADFQVRSDTAILPSLRPGVPPVTRPWSTARSPSAGRHGPPGRHHHSQRLSHRQHPGGRPGKRGGSENPGQPPPPSRPKAIRAVRSWPTPWLALRHWWQAWSNAPPPAQLQNLIEAVATGQALNLYSPT